MSDRYAAPAASGAGTLALLGQMLLCSFLWAPAFLLMKRIGTDVSPLTVTALRDLIGGALMAGWFLAIRKPMIPKGREWYDWTILGILQVIIPNTLTVYALGQITTSLASLIQTSTPLVVAVLAHMLFASERMTARRAVGVALGVAGVLVLIGPQIFQPASGALSGSFSGALVMAGVPVSYAIGNIYVRSLPRAVPMRLAYGQLVFSGFPALALVLLTTGREAFATVPAHMTELAVLSLFATVIPLVMFMHILRKAGPTVGTMVGYLIPFWTILLGALVLDETLGLREILGAAVLLAGLGVASATRVATPAES